ncbi:MAG: DUF4861 domain-containing protein, partial [Rikenellaceae bacterium]|nr:DUF4861 domain-containing protein [Rikenellaceae bacterium]
MNNRTFAAIAAALCMLAALPLSARDMVHTYKVTNGCKYARPDAPVVVPIPETWSWVRSTTVFVAGTNAEIPSQLDDLNGNGVPDEVVFTTDFEGGQSRDFWVLFTNIAPVKERYPARVHAQMFLKNGSVNEPKKEICATADNMYNKLHHHGPAFESELVAYRIYFDKKQTADLYGKYEKGLELAETMWYPTDKQLAEGAGDDIIRVFGSVGVGTLKGWDPETGKATHIAPVARRCARIVVNGPVRTIVDMRVEAWEYRGRKVDLTSRYVLYAGHRDCEVRNTLKNASGLTFCTGVMKMAERTTRLNQQEGTLATWGTDYPVNDTVKFAKQTVGLAVYVSPWRIREQ